MVPSRMKRVDLVHMFGDEAKQERLDRLRGKIVPQRSKTQKTMLNVAEKHGRAVGHDGVRVSNPVMNAFAELVDSTMTENPGLMTGAHVIALQHLLGSTGGLLRGFTELGARPGDIIAMGKRYSQSDPVIDDLFKSGFRVRPAKRESATDVELNIDSMGIGTRAEHWAARANFDEVSPRAPVPNRATEIDNAIRDLIEVVARNKGKTSAKILVVDDGGELIQRIQDQHPELHDRIVAVEQTRKGIRRLEKMKLDFPVIDVAQSTAKLKYESPMIGRSIAKSTMERLARLEEAGQIVPRRIVTVSYGAVGAAASRALRRAGFQVEVYDRSPAVRKRAKRDGFRVFETQDEALARAEVMLSMTGETVLDGEALRKLPVGAILINGASSATELLPDRNDMLRGLIMNSVEGHGDEARVFAYHLGKRFEMGRVQAPRGYLGNAAPRGFDYPLRITRAGERPSKQDPEVLLVNQGEVVNFDGTVDPIPPRYIQLTRGLLFLGGVQAMKTTQPGIHALNEDAQQRWVKAVETDLAATGESLDRPVF